MSQNVKPEPSPLPARPRVTRAPAETSGSNRAPRGTCPGMPLKSRICTIHPLTPGERQAPVDCREIPALELIGAPRRACKTPASSTASPSSPSWRGWGLAADGLVVVFVRTARGFLVAPRRPAVPGKPRLLAGGPRDRDSGDRLHHLLRVQPHHRALPLRRRWLRGGHQAPRPQRRRRLRLCAAGRDYVLTITTSIAAGAEAVSQPFCRTVGWARFGCRWSSSSSASWW